MESVEEAIAVLRLKIVETQKIRNRQETWLAVLTQVLVDIQSHTRETTRLTLEKFQADPYRILTQTLTVTLTLTLMTSQWSFLLQRRMEHLVKGKLLNRSSEAGGMKPWNSNEEHSAYEMVYLQVGKYLSFKNHHCTITLLQTTVFHASSYRGWNVHYSLLRGITGESSSAPKCCGCSCAWK